MPWATGAIFLKYGLYLRAWAEVLDGIMYAIIGGSGLTGVDGFMQASARETVTPYGAPSGPLMRGRIGGREVLFLARHGPGHTIPPHRINYRANMHALKDSGATAIVAVATVGGISAGLKSGDLMVPDQIIDYTWGRESTYHDGADAGVIHVDFTQPYAMSVRSAILSAAQYVEIPLLDGGVYAATQGPRLETAAEIDRLERDGADVVGMTGMPEAVLARELGIAYGTLAVVVNPAAGRGDSASGIDVQALQKVVDLAMVKVRSILAQLVLHDP